VVLPGITVCIQKIMTSSMYPLQPQYHQLTAALVAEKVAGAFFMLKGMSL